MGGGTRTCIVNCESQVMLEVFDYNIFKSLNSSGFQEIRLHPPKWLPEQRRHEVSVVEPEELAIRSVIFS